MIFSASFMLRRRDDIDTCFMLLIMRSLTLYMPLQVCTSVLCEWHHAPTRSFEALITLSEISGGNFTDQLATFSSFTVHKSISVFFATQLIVLWHVCHVLAELQAKPKNQAGTLGRIYIESYEARYQVLLPANNFPTIVVSCGVRDDCNIRA